MTRPSPGTKPGGRAPADERRRRYWSGHASEWLAAAYLMAKGYRILARRMKTPLGEIDLIAVRGRRIAFIEVKRRTTFDACEAAITPAQSRRIRDAADLWLSRRPRYHDYEIGFDALFLARRSWPRHIPNRL
jgi:putative endonuclease